MENTIARRNSNKLSRFSVPVQKRLTTNGITLNCPEIVSYKNGVVEWKLPSDATGCVLTVDGVCVCDGDLFHGGKYDLSSARDGAIVSIAASDGQKRSAAVSFALDKKSDALILPPVDGIELNGEKLTWKPYGGAIGYRVTDIDDNVRVVRSTVYDMADRSLVSSVYPVIESTVIDSSRLAPCGTLPYLKGSGSVSSPYRIYTPFDLRTIDYYEDLFARKGSSRRNSYKIMQDIDYDTVGALEDETNIYSLKKPFFGVLDGDNRTLSGITVNYDGGYWALFDFAAAGSVIKNITFDSPTIVNVWQSSRFYPVDASIATVAFIGYGTVSGIKLRYANYSSAGGEVSGIVAHNYGCVTGCSVESSKFAQGVVGMVGQACYEMAGIVGENLSGGVVSSNTVLSLDIVGSTCEGGGSTYNNVRTAGGIVAVNRAGGIVGNNRYSRITMVGMSDRFDGLSGGYEWGGIVAYNAGSVLIGGRSNIGTFKWNGTIVTECNGAVRGATGDQRKRDVGKNDGTVA